jgi:uncharacterized damage-inducible protein DinB
MNEALREAFRHGAWATRTLLAACRGLPREQLEHRVRGYGTLLATLNHVIGSDAGYLSSLGGARVPWAKDGAETDDLDQLEARAEEVAGLWERLLSAPFDAERLLLLDGGTYECHASVVLAQALHHGAAHREQVRAALKDLGVKPPDLQPWEYALATGRAHWRPAPG